MADSFDAIVVGLGAVGSACLYQLARAGQRVLGIDAHRPPHDRGSSHGETRITRQAVGEGEVYAPLVLRSHAIWRELEAETGMALLQACGALVMAAGDGAALHHGSGDFVRRGAAVAERFGIAHELLDAGEIGRRYPQFRLRGDEIGCFEPGGGFVRPEACIAAQLAMAARLGARVLCDTVVCGHAADGPDAVVVRTADGGVFRAAKVVLAAGPWLPGMLPAQAGRMRVCRQVLHWFGASGEYAPGRFPVFIWMHGDRAEDYFYGFPEAVPGGGVKLATEQYGDVTPDPDRLLREVAASEAAEMYATHAAPRLAGLAPVALRSSACMYTVTAGSEFLVDYLPGEENLLLVSACSGHGFKHSAGLGEMVARNLAAGAAFPFARLG